MIVLVAAFAVRAEMPTPHETPKGTADGRRPGLDLPLLVGSDKLFGALMGEAMVSMDDAMKAAPMTGDPDHDVVAMMIPHH